MADVGCGYHATFAAVVLDDVDHAALLDVALDGDLKRHPHVEVIEGPLPDTLAQLEATRFDVVLCISVLEHLWEPQQALDEMWRLLRPGGLCLVNVPSWRGKRFLEFSAFRLGLSPADEMNDHKAYYDPRDLWPMLVQRRVPSPGHPTVPAQVRPQHLRRAVGGRPSSGPRPAHLGSTMATFTETYLRETQRILGALDAGRVEAVARDLAAVRERGGRLFVLGVGGSAGHAGHAVNDFRKLCGFEAYAPTDNVSELTARTNDEGWDSVFSAWLEGSRLSAEDALLVLSVGGGDVGAQRVPQHRAGRSNSRRRSALASTGSSAATAATPPRRPQPRAS